MKMQTIRTARSLATALPKGPLFTEATDENSGVDQGLVDSLTERPAPKSESQRAQAEVREETGLSARDARDLFSSDPVIAQAALKRAAKVAGLSEADLQARIDAAKPQVEPEVEVDDDDDDDGDTGDVAEAISELRQGQVDSLLAQVDDGLDKIMAGPEIGALRDAYKRLNGEKADLGTWNKNIREMLTERVGDGFRRVSYDKGKVNRDTVKKILDGSQKSVVGLVRQTLGDPSSIGRQASERSGFPGIDIPEEKTRLPDDRAFKENPTQALDAASDATKNFLTKRLSQMRAGGKSSV